MLPNFAFFGWMVLLVEASLGAFLLIGLATRFWAVIGVAQTVVIMLSVLNAPHEWYWSHLLMLLVHLALFAGSWPVRRSGRAVAHELAALPVVRGCDCWCVPHS